MEFANDDKWDVAYFKQDDSEKRRSDDCEYLSGLGMSEFSSAICEFIVKYWSLENANIVDPFAGRATRAIISSKLGRNYQGYEISPNTFNRSLAQYKVAGVNPTLHLSNGCYMSETKDESAHLVMTCPPYGSIEKYESVAGQLSDIKKYDEFLANISVCASNIYRVLKPGGFCCWVVGDWRDGHGYHQFGSDSIQLFKMNGLLPHDTIIIKNNSPFAALQAGKAASKRISSKIHEYLLVFRKEGELDLTGLKMTEINKTATEFFEL
jgi:DNA modification methylase